MKKIMITVMLGIICTGIMAQKNSALAMVKLKSKDVQFKGQLLYRLTFSEYNQLALGKKKYTNVYSYVLAVDSVALNSLRDAIQTKIKAMGSNINQSQVTTAIESLASDKVLQQLMKSANAFQVNFNGGMVSMGDIENGAGGSTNTGNMPASLYNQLFNLGGQINDPSGYAKDDDQTKDENGKPLPDSPDDPSTIDKSSNPSNVNENQVDKVGNSRKNDDGSTTTVYRSINDPKSTYVANSKGGKTVWTHCSNCPGGSSTPAPDDGSVGNPAQYLQHILGSKLFSGMAKQFFTALQIKLGAGVDVPGKGTTIEQEIAFEIAMEGHFFQAWKAGLDARRNGNDGSPFNPQSAVSGAIEISFNSNLGAVDPSQISMKVNGNAIIVK